MYNACFVGRSCSPLMVTPLNVLLVDKGVRGLRLLKTYTLKKNLNLNPNHQASSNIEKVA